MPLTDDQIKMWQGRLELARKYQKEHGNQGGRWDENIKAQAGDFGSKAEDDEAIDVNLVYSTNNTVLPPLWLQDPFITFRPTRERVDLGGRSVDNQRRAEYSTVEVNYWLRELKVRQRVTRPCVMDAEATNHGYAFVWYTKDKADVENAVGESVEPEPEIRLKQPLVKRISPKQILLPPGGWHLEMHEWLGIEWLMRLEDVKNRWPETTEGLKASRNLWPSADGKADPTGSKMLDEYLQTEDSKLVSVCQVFDKRTQQVLHLAQGHDTVLEEDDWDIETEGFPIVDLSFGEVPDEYYGTPPTTYYLPQNREINYARTSARRRFNRHKRVGIASASVSDEFIGAFNRAKDGEIVKADVDGDIRQHFMFEEPWPLDNTQLLYPQMAENDIRNIKGVSAEQRGAADPNIDTATQSANIEKHVQVRGTDRGDRVRTFYLDIARKLHMILRQFPDVKRERMVAGPIAGQFTTVTYTLDELKGEYALEMDLSTVLPDNPQIRQARAFANYNLLRADPLVNPEWLVVNLLKAQNVPNPEEALLFLRNPDEEFQMMMQGLPVEPHDRDNHEVHLQSHDAQLDQVDQLMDQIPPGHPAYEKVRMVSALLLAHVNSTMRIVAAITGQSAGRQAGSPVAENLFRSQQQQVSGRETTAELTGQPLTPGAV